METRTLGNTNLQIGILGLGTEYLAKQDPSTIRNTLQAAFADDVNYFDLVFAYTDFLEIFGEVVRKSKKKVIVGCHIGCGLFEGRHVRMRKPEMAEKAFEETLSALNMDSVDIGIIQLATTGDYHKIMQPGKLYDMAVRLQKEGKIKHIGISIHHSELAIEAIQSGKFSVLLTQFNFFTAGLVDRLKILDAAEKANIGLIAIKPFAGGALLQPGKDIKIPNYKRGGHGIKLKMPRGLTVPRCLSYILDLNAISCVIPGAKNPEELNENLAALTTSTEDRNYDQLEKEFQKIH